MHTDGLACAQTEARLLGELSDVRQTAVPRAMAADNLCGGRRGLSALVGTRQSICTKTRKAAPFALREVKSAPSGGGLTPRCVVSPERAGRKCPAQHDSLIPWRRSRAPGALGPTYFDFGDLYGRFSVRNRSWPDR